MGSNRLPLQGPCEHCGAYAPRRKVVKIGAVAWDVCPPCHRSIQRFQKTGQRTNHPFPYPTYDLPPPDTSGGFWGSYRLACQRLGYTWVTAKDRAERDALSVEEMRIAAESLLARQVRDNPTQNFVVKEYVGELREMYGTTKLTKSDAQYLRAMDTRTDRQKGLRPSETATNVIVPPRGALSTNGLGGGDGQEA